MSKKSKAKLEKKKRREREVRRARNIRQAGTERAYDVGEGLDLLAALEELPVELQFERIQRRIARTTGQRVFASGEEALAALEKLDAPGAAKTALVGSPARPDVREEAQDLVLLALDPANEDLVDTLTARALELDPENVDAAAQRAILVGPDIASMVSALEAITAHAERDLADPTLPARTSGPAWDDVFARPWLRTRRKLAEVLLLGGRRMEAAAHFEALIALDPEAPLDTVDFALGFALERGHLERARELVAISDQAGSPVARWALALERWLAGDLPRASQLVLMANAENFMVVFEVLEPGSTERARSRWPAEIAYENSTLGGVAEHVERRIGAAWHAHPQALAWLAEGAGVSTDEDRERVCASFAPPVSSLLELGEENLDDTWIDYAARLGLRASDVPELLRMATDPALRELDEEDVRGWGPQHAWRALGVLGAAGAIGPLLDLAARWPEDEILDYDMLEVCTRIGEPALWPLIAVLSDTRRDAHERGLAAAWLAEVAADEPEWRARALAAFARELERGEENEPELNAWLVAALINMQAVELVDEIRSFYDRGLVDEDIAGSWRSVAKELGVPRRTRSRGRPGAGDAD